MTERATIPYVPTQHQINVEQSCQNITKIIEEIKPSKNKEIYIERITDPNEAININSFLAKTFSKDEIDMLETTKKHIELNQANYNIARNKKGEIIAVSSSSLIDYIKPEGDNFNTIEPRQSTIFISYILTDPKYRQNGLSSSLYQNTYIEAISDARKNQSIIKGIIGESVETAENYLNKMNRKRIYFNDKDGNIQEVKYLCPPLHYDDQKKNTKSNITPEHLMYRALDNQQEFTTTELLSIVKGIYKEMYVLKTLQNEKTKKYNVKLVLKIYHQLEKELQQAQNGKVFLMSATERAEKKVELESKGKKLIDFVLEKNK